ncbi:pentatricopeptide repeat-containing protein, putative, partial [Ricinus communis]
MTKRLSFIILSHSLKNPVFPSRFISTSSSDNLHGLVDPEDPSTSDNSRVDYFTNEEFSFLRDSLLAPNDARQKLHAGKFSNDAVSIAQAILNNHDGFGINAQKFLRQYRPKLTQSLVVEVLNQIKNPELGIHFFLWAGRQIGYCHTLPVYNALLEIIETSTETNDGVPQHLLLQIKDDEKEVLGKLLNVLIRKLCQNGLWNAALEELGRLKNLGYKASRLTYNALLQVFLRAERLDTAYLVLREMLALGYSMDEFTLGCFAYSL